MTIKKLVQDLNNKKGYVSNGKLKKGKQWLADHYQVSTKDIETALKVIRATSSGQGVVYKEDIQVQAKSTKIDSDTPLVYWVSGCIHFPFHNKRWYEKTLKYLKDIERLDGIILAGDILDMNSLSFHDKGKTPIPGVTLSGEYAGANRAFDKIVDLIKHHDVKDLHFMYGNHEDRYNRTLKQIDQSKYGSALDSPESALQLNQKGFKIYKDWQKDFIELGDLMISHGEFLNQHVSKKSIDVYKQSTLFFHTHRFQIYSEGKIVGYNMGFGGDKDAPCFNFATRGQKLQWTNCSALVTVYKGKTSVQPLLYINDNLIVNGIVY